MASRCCVPIRVRGIAPVTVPRVAATVPVLPIVPRAAIAPVPVTALRVPVTALRAAVTVPRAAAIAVAATVRRQRIGPAALPVEAAVADATAHWVAYRPDA